MSPARRWVRLKKNHPRVNLLYLLDASWARFLLRGVNALREKKLPMPFEWLDRFQQHTEKPADYAEKTLAAYRLGMKASGAIVGVSIQVASPGCLAAQALPAGKVYHPDEAPRLPLPGCTTKNQCHCVYRPVMGYQLTAPDGSVQADPPK